MLQRDGLCEWAIFNQSHLIYAQSQMYWRYAMHNTYNDYHFITVRPHVYMLDNEMRMHTVFLEDRTLYWINILTNQEQAYL